MAMFSNDKKMDYRIKAEIADRIEETLGGGVDAKFVDVKKANGLVLTGVNVSKAGSNITPVIYIDESIKAFRDGKATAGDVAKNLTDKDFILSNVHVRLLNAEKNPDVKEDPHGSILDLVWEYRVDVADDATVKVSKAMMDLRGITENELKEAAFRNMEDDSIFVRPMAELLAEMTGFPVEDAVPLWVVSNEDKMYGASALLRNDLLKDVAESRGCDLYLIPSSVHEILILPVSEAEGMDVDGLRNLIRMVNDTEVAPNEYLSDNAYLFCKDTGELKIA